MAVSRLEPMSTGAKLTTLVATLTGLMLLLRPVLAATNLAPDLGDPGILIAGALVLFVLPSFEPGAGQLLRWCDARQIRWDVLILFGGGLALAGAIGSSGLAQGAGSLFAGLAGVPIPVAIMLAMLIVVVLGELASNTAMAAVFLPIAGAAAATLQLDALDLVIPIGLAASLGFMLPVATPPNAIVCGTGAVTQGEMIRAGALLDVATVPVVYVIALALAPWVVDMSR